MHKLHTLNAAWRDSLTVRQSSGNPLARAKDIIWVICPQGIGIKTVIQYMQTTEHLNLAIIFGPCQPCWIKSRNGAADDFPAYSQCVIHFLSLPLLPNSCIVTNLHSSLSRAIPSPITFYQGVVMKNSVHPQYQRSVHYLICSKEKVT